MDTALPLRRMAIFQFPVVSSVHGSCDVVLPHSTIKLRIPIQTACIYDNHYRMVVLYLCLLILIFAIVLCRSWGFEWTVACRNQIKLY